MIITTIERLKMYILNTDLAPLIQRRSKWSSTIIKVTMLSLAIIGKKKSRSSNLLILSSDQIRSN